MSTASVLQRYSEGAKVREQALCCPVDYDRSLLKLLPAEIIERDYGCGDPSRYVRDGDVVLDLGSGGGKICYMAAQLVGEQGHVIGVDMNDDMLTLARGYQGEMAEKLGGDRVTFHKGTIQDLALSLDKTQQWLAEHGVTETAELLELYAFQEAQRREAPLIADNSVDLVVSNCVLNLVSERERRQMIAEILRVLKPYGRVAISDIIADESVPEHLKRDTHLWSGCISGAFQEKDFLDAFTEAGFVGVSYDKWQASPWQVVEGIEFRSATLLATKPGAGECLDYGHAVIYRGPYREVLDDAGRRFPRGERMAVSERSYRLLLDGPYKEDFIGIVPAQDVAPKAWCETVDTRRPAAQTKGSAHTTPDNASGSCC